jgi:hypothetical protein
MISITAYHRTQCNERIEFLALRHGLQHQRNLQCARHGSQGDIVLADAAEYQLLAASRQQPFAHDFIETALHDADAQALAVQVLFDLFHFVSLH